MKKRRPNPKFYIVEIYFIKRLIQGEDVAMLPN